jgi:hypothetical protein
MTPLPRSAVPIAAFLAAAFASGPLRAQERSRWTLDPSLYIFVPGLSGTVGIGNIDVDLSSPSNVLLNINFAFMGNVRVGYGDWAFTIDAFYGNVGATKNQFSGSVKELIVEPTVSYRVFRWFEPLVGFRYDSVLGDTDGPLGRNQALRADWFDPIVGANLRLPLGSSVDLVFRGDVGGFGVGSKFTWQAFPTSRGGSRSSSPAGRISVLAVDYESGTGRDRIKYDIVEPGPHRDRRSARPLMRAIASGRRRCCSPLRRRCPRRRRAAAVLSTRKTDGSTSPASSTRDTARSRHRARHRARGRVRRGGSARLRRSGSERPTQ